MKIAVPYQRKKARIEIIPLIDIIFFLLATFVMVSLSMVKNQGISVNLPVATTSAPQEKKLHSMITLTKSGEIYLDKELMDMKELTVKLKKLKASDPDLTITINGDDEAFFGKAIAVLDEVRRLGISKVAIQTKNQPAGVK